jgi:hypothetical protein
MITTITTVTISSSIRPPVAAIGTHRDPHIQLRTGRRVETELAGAGGRAFLRVPQSRPHRALSREAAADVAAGKTKVQ